VDPSCKRADPYAENLIEVLSLQAYTRSEVRLVIDNLISQVSKTNFSIFNAEMKFNIFKVSKKKFNIFNLIKVI